MTYIFVSLGALTVGIDSDANYPDAIDDITNRTKNLLNEALEMCKEKGLDPLAEYATVPDFDDYNDEDED